MDKGDEENGGGEGTTESERGQEEATGAVQSWRHGAVVDREHQDSGIKGVEAIGEVRSQIHRTFPSDRRGECTRIHLRSAGL